MDIEKEREAFEEKFPIPAHWIEFDKKRNKYFCPYCADAAASAYQSQWETWQAKAKAVPEWISVKNAMPKAGSWFVAYDDFNGFVEIGKADGHEDPNNVFFSHWLPLPNVPQEPTND